MNGRAESCGSKRNATADVRKDASKCEDDERNIEEHGRDGAR